MDDIQRAETALFFLPSFSDDESVINSSDEYLPANDNDKSSPPLNNLGQIWIVHRSLLFWNTVSEL